MRTEKSLWGKRNSRFSQKRRETGHPPLSTLQRPHFPAESSYEAPIYLGRDSGDRIRLGGGRCATRARDETGRGRQCPATACPACVCARTYGVELSRSFAG